MSSQPSRAAIDLAPATPPRPTLALALALLALPGSTVAWDLPLGGLWIGLPLALAATVLGRRASRQRAGKRRATAAIVLAGLCIAQMAVWTAVSALASDASGHGTSSRTLTFKELDESATFTQIRNTDGPQQSNLQGDLFASVAPWPTSPTARSASSTSPASPPGKRATSGSRR